MPSPYEIHRNRPLENIAVAFKPEGMIASQLSPTVPVTHESDQYFEFTKDNFRIESAERANGAPAAQVSFAMTIGTYNLTEYALKDLVTERSRANADPALRLDVDTTENLVDKISLRQEQLLATMIGTPGNWANRTSLTSTFAWSQNTTLSNPISFVDSATSVIARQSGKKANTVALDELSFKYAKEHTSVVDRVKYTSPDSVTESLLATLFGVEQVLRASVSYNNSGEGVYTTTSMSFLWTDAAFVAYIERNPGLKKASALYTFKRNGMTAPFKVRKWFDNERNGDWIEVSTMLQHRAIATDCAYLIGETA